MWQVRLASAQVRRGVAVQSRRPIWAQAGPFWTWSGQAALAGDVTWSGCGSTGRSRMAVTAAAYVQQRGGGDFTGPTWARPGLRGLVCPCHRVRSAPAGGGGGRPPGGYAVAAIRTQTVFLHRLSGHTLDLATPAELADAGAAAPEGGLHGRLGGGRRGSGDGRLFGPRGWRGVGVRSSWCWPRLGVFSAQIAR